MGSKKKLRKKYNIGKLKVSFNSIPPKETPENVAVEIIDFDFNIGDMDIRIEYHVYDMPKPYRYDTVTIYENGGVAYRRSVDLTGWRPKDIIEYAKHVKLRISEDIQSHMKDIVLVPIGGKFKICGPVFCQRIEVNSDVGKKDTSVLTVSSPSISVIPAGVDSVSEVPYTVVDFDFVVDCANGQDSIRFEFIMHDNASNDKFAVYVNDSCVSTVNIGKAEVDNIVQILNNVNIVTCEPNQFFDDAKPQGIIITECLGSTFFRGNIQGIPTAPTITHPKINELHIPMIVSDSSGDADLVPPAMHYFVGEVMLTR